MYFASLLFVQLALLALVGVLVRRLAVFVVETGGISAGLIALAALFWIGRYLSVKYDL